MTFLRGNSDVLQRFAVEMYARGLSTRDIETALEEGTGDRLLSRTAGSHHGGAVGRVEAFAERDLSGFEVAYLFLDTVYESLRQQGGGKEGVLCAWAICTDGRPVSELDGGSGTS
jgi:transposase-like protein